MGPGMWANASSGDNEMKAMKRRVIQTEIIVVCAMVCVATVHAAEKTALKVELPKPMFVGTPKNIKTENLERPLRPGRKRPEILVPAGVTIVSKGKTVTGSDTFPIIGDMELLTDGDKEGSDGSYTEFGPGQQHVQIDLGETCEIYAIAVWHYHAQARVYRDMVVQIGQDADFITDVETVFNNDHDNSAGLGIGKDKEYIETNSGRVIDAKGKKGRFVRLYSNGSTAGEMNHYIEVEVFGKPAS